MDVAIYSRISTDKQDNQNQLDQLRGFAASQGWRIKREYVDIATGKHGEREEFKALFKAASRREFELVLFWSLDRFSREGVLETLTYLQSLTQYWRRLSQLHGAIPRLLRHVPGAVSTSKLRSLHLRYITSFMRNPVTR